MYSLTPVCISDVLLNVVDVKNSFHTNDMNVVSPLYELPGVSSSVKLSKCLSTLITCVQFLSSVDVYVFLKVSFV